jgi:hypothetical protein
MSDFVGDKSKPRKILGVTTRRPGTASREEHPITALRRVARDFAAGVSALHRTLGQTKPVEATRPAEFVRSDRTIERSHHTHTAQRTNQISSTLKEIQGAFSYKQAVIERLSGRPPQPAQTYTGAPVTPTSPSSIRVSSPRLSAQRARSAKTHRASAVAAGADREARHHLDNAATGGAQEMPSAARLAQIVRADQLMRTGEVSSHPQVQRWAEAIRAGKRREIADINPGRVETILHEAMGGREAAQQRLSTPEINQLIDRHHSTLQTIQSGLRETEKIIDRVGNRAPRRTRTGTRVEPTHLSSAAAARDYSGLVAPSVPTDQRTDISRLSEMLATNEEPHLHAEGDERRQIMQQSQSDMVSGATGGASSAGSEAGATAGSQKTHKRTSAPAAHAMAHREIPSAMSAPPQRAASTHDAQDPNKGRKKDRMELSGTMTLVSRGQTLGEMQVSAEMR